MPELPEVENVARALRSGLQGRRLTGLKVRFAGVLGQSTRRTRSALLGKTLTGVHRHGKYLILTFTDDMQDPSRKAGPGGTKPAASAESVAASAAEDTAAHLMIHLRMTGQILSLPGYIPDQHVHLVFDFDGLPVYYRDIRKFGRLVLVDHPTCPAATAHVGPDMLTVRFKPWHQALAGRTAPIKALLLDQGIAAGLGNIYVDESLFLAGVHPQARPVDLSRDQLHEVWRRAKQVLRLACKHGGTTFLNFANFNGRPGNYRRKLRVYGRRGEPCRDCGATLERVRVAGRSSVFCPVCQALGSTAASTATTDQRDPD